MEEIQEVDIFSREDLLDIMGVSILEFMSEKEAYGIRFLPRSSGARIRWVPCQRTAVDEGEALDLVLSKRSNLRTEVVLDDETGFINKACYVPDTTPLIKQDTGNEVIISVDAPTVGWLVLSDTWYPGWKVFIDGERSKLYKANYAFKAVEVPPGNHEVIFEYNPVSIYIGGIITLLVITGIVWFMLKQKK
jgi:uncharacterized membrane protein YfhO